MLLNQITDGAISSIRDLIITCYNEGKDSSEVMLAFAI